MYQAVLFDMDGVVVDTEASVAEFWQELAASERFSLSRDQLERHVYGRSAEHTLRALFPGIPEHRWDEVYARMRHDNETRRYTPVPGVLDTLTALHDAEVPVALVTGAQRWKADAVLAQLQLTFTTCVSAEDVPKGKPDPAGYALAAARLDVPPGRCLVFEDAVSGVAAAVAAGATCVALAPPRRRDQVLRAGAIAAVTDFRDVAFAEGHLELRRPARLRFTFDAVRKLAIS